MIIYLAALLIYLNALFASHLSTAGIVPTRASLLLPVDRWRTRAWPSGSTRPRCPAARESILLAAGGIGLMAAATDLLAVRLRSPAIAGLPLLALYCVRITTNAKQGGVGATMVFCLAMIGYLALLAADGRERLRIWGRLVTVWHGAAAGAAEAAEAPDTRALAASGRRIGLAAACIALAFPLLVPGISVHDLFKIGRDRPRGRAAADRAAQPAGPDARSAAERVAADRPDLYARPRRSPSEQYLQVYVLNYDLSGQAWTLVPPGGPTTAVGSGQLPAAPGVADSTPATEYDHQDHAQPWEAPGTTRSWASSRCPTRRRRCRSREAGRKTTRR